MTKIEAIRYLQTCGTDLSWIANVFSVGGGRGQQSAKTLKAIASLVRQGHEVSSISFMMPYEYMLVDGESKTPAQVREMADKSYGKNKKVTWSVVGFDSYDLGAVVAASEAEAEKEAREKYGIMVAYVEKV